MIPQPEPLPPLPPQGRRFQCHRQIRLADVTPSGRMRLDAMARVLQDAAYDDVVDGGLDEPAWVVRRTRISVREFPRFLDTVEVTTFCWSMGSRYAERRTSLRTDAGAAVDTLTLWVRLDPATGRPTQLSDAFRALYEEAVQGRRTRPQLWLPEQVGAGDGQAWPVRHSDLDLMAHVNNAVYWTALEDELAGRPDADAARDVEMEFRVPISAGDRVRLVRARQGDADIVWLADAAPTDGAAARTFATGVIWPG